MDEFVIEKELNGYLVDIGYADVGPFNTKEEAQEHIDRIVRSRKEHDEL